ncbi:hypothetical protein RR48_04411 [Papilio machaon]|uniref:TATA box binding protein associated factor (TAF) histone-like fold domain-containing protein n=1 Tax=Papilio machaon TaxID=76193 RepID=A0A0N0PCA8_PAPMA|nr:hypothetical protein RR48_04411 [Papilio machaon]
MSNLSSSSNKNHSKKVNSGRERDKNKPVASESGSSQCDTPPLLEKDGGSVQGKFAGVGADSILCIAEQVAAELTGEAAANLAEDISYKLRQTISTIALHSEMMKKSRIDSWDVNTVFTLSDTSPSIGTTNNVYAPLGEEKLCFQTESILNVTEYAMTSQTYVFSTLPSVSVEWITDDRSLSSNSNISFNLHNYYTNVARVMVSNILGNGSLAEKMVAILTKITRTWPSFIAIGKGILFDYLSQGTKERLTAPMIRCVMALGRQALISCLADYLDHLDTLIHAPRRNHAMADLRETILDASTCLLRSEPTTFLEDFVTTDYTLYEMLGDSIMPRRTLFPYKETATCQNTKEKSPEEEFSFLPLRPPIVITRAKVRLLPVTRKVKTSHHRDEVFEPCNFTIDKSRIFLKIKNCRSKEIPQTMCPDRNHISVARNGVVVCSGVLNRFKYRLKKSNNAFPIFGVFTL